MRSNKLGAGNASFRSRSWGAVLSAVIICAAAFSSAPAHAYKLKAVLTPAVGNTVEVQDAGGVETLFGDYEERTSFFGFGIVADLLKGPHKIALDYYAGVNAYTYRGETKAHLDLSDGSVSLLEAEGEAELHNSINVLLLGYRWHYRSGFYVGGGLLVPRGFMQTDIVATGQNIRTGRANTFYDTIIYDIGGGSGTALTLGYDWTAPSGLSLGVHAMSGAGSIDYSSPDVNPAGERMGDDFRMQQIGLGIGYDFDQEN